MYEKTLNKPVEFRAKGNASEAAIDILQKVTGYVKSLVECEHNQ